MSVSDKALHGRMVHPSCSSSVWLGCRIAYLESHGAVGMPRGQPHSFSCGDAELLPPSSAEAPRRAAGATRDGAGHQVASSGGRAGRAGLPSGLVKGYWLDLLCAEPTRVPTLVSLGKLSSRLYPGGSGHQLESRAAAGFPRHLFEKGISSG